MEEYLMYIKMFLDEIPQFLADLEPDEDYLLVPGTSFWKALFDYSIDPTEANDGFIVSGVLKLFLDDAKQLPEWNKYASQNPNASDDEIFEMVAHERPSISTAFDLEDFCTYFEETYLQFLDDNSLDPDFIEINADTIKFVRN